MDGFERRSSEKKVAIMWAALELFSTHGYEKISMSDIAAKGQVSRVSIYNYFGSKENLRKLLAKNIMDDSLERLNVLINSEDTLINKIVRLLGSHKFPYSYVKFFYDTIEMDMDLSEYYNNFANEYAGMVKSLIMQGKQIGIISREISDAAIENYIDMYMTYIARTEKLRDTAELYPEVLEDFRKLFLSGLIMQGDDVETANQKS